MSSWVDMGVAAFTGGGITGLLNYLTRKRRDKQRDEKRFDQITLAVYERVAEAQKELMAQLQREVSELRMEMTKVETSNALLTRRIIELENKNASLVRTNGKLERRVKDLERELKAHGLEKAVE